MKQSGQYYRMCETLQRTELFHTAVVTKAIILKHDAVEDVACCSTFRVIQAGFYSEYEANNHIRRFRNDAPTPRHSP